MFNLGNQFFFDINCENGANISKWLGGRETWETIKKIIELGSKHLNSFFYALKRTQCTKKNRKPNENDSNFRDWHLYNNTPLIVQNNKLWNGPGFPYHYRRSFTTWVFISYEWAFFFLALLFHEVFLRNYYKL